MLVSFASLLNSVRTEPFSSRVVVVFKSVPVVRVVLPFVPDTVAFVSPFGFCATVTFDSNPLFVALPFITTVPSSLTLTSLAGRREFVLFCAPLCVFVSTDTEPLGAF